MHYYLAIIKQVVFGSRDCDGIVTYWKPNYGLVKSPFAMECLRKLCRKAIFVPYSEAREYFINLMIDKDEVHIPEELSIHYLNSLYHSQALHVSATRDSNVRRNDGLSVYDAVMAGNKCSLKIFQHSRSQALEYDQFPEDLVTFLYEIEILKVLNDASTPCPNIVRLLASGVDLPTHIIIEKATKGDLFNYLLNFKKNPILASELKKISLDICSAMIFLGERGIIHRDLRSANVLVFDSCDGEVVSKLSDFHLSTLENYCPRSPSVSRRNRFVVSSNDPSSSLPFAVRWMAVESLRLGEFSTDSDVWSFGVLLFEIFTLGCRPYENMPNGMSLYEDEDVKEFVSVPNNPFYLPVSKFER